MRIRACPGIVLLAALGGCASGQSRPAASDSIAADRAAIVVRGDDMSGNLLDGLRFRVPSMRVSTSAGGCPRILFRGIRSVHNQGDPTVYVDGTRMADTCILTQISASDVEYVELYPSGVPPRASYEQSPFGIIVVFRKRE